MKRKIEGVEARLFIEGGFWVTKDGKVAQWAFINHETGEIGKTVTYKIKEDEDGNPYVDVKQKDGSYKKFLISEAVCTCWHGRRPTATARVIHIDKDLGNNESSNLKWKK